MSPLADLFPDGDYRFHLTLRPVTPQSFFLPRDPFGVVLAERRRWLAEQPARYAALQPGGRPLLREFSDEVSAWGQREVPDVVALGRQCEPDVLFLAPDAQGLFRLRGGALCFPTGWALEEKLGLTLDEIHGVVPGLNEALAAPIQRFLARLKPGQAFGRDNWGIAATAQLNLHPARQLPPPQLPVALDRLWLRVEHQALWALPGGSGIVFGLRIALHRLDVVRGDPVAGPRLGRALASMPAEVAAYKRLDGVRAELVRLLAYP